MKNSLLVAIAVCALAASGQEPTRSFPAEVELVALEIAATGSESNLLSLPARIVATSTPGRVLAQAAVNTDALEPGRYVARLAISSSGQRIAMVHRSFGIAAP